MTDHTTCCCTETLTDLRALKAAYRSAYRAYEDAGRERDEMAGRLTEAIDERDRARDTAARLEAELARGFRVAAPDVTLSRTHDGPATPDDPESVDGIVQIRPGSENTSADTYPPKNGPESPDKPVTARTAPAAPDRSDKGTL